LAFIALFLFVCFDREIRPSIRARARILGTRLRHLAAQQLAAARVMFSGGAVERGPVFRRDFLISAAQLDELPQVGRTDGRLKLGLVGIIAWDLDLACPAFEIPAAFVVTATNGGRGFLEAHAAATSRLAAWSLR
jgi:hypothetical protein